MNTEINKQTVKWKNWVDRKTPEERKEFNLKKAEKERIRYHSRKLEGQRPSAPLSPDLTLGSECSKDTPIVPWVDGSKTILPYIPRPRPVENRTRRRKSGRPVEVTINALDVDAQAAFHLASCPFATEQNPGPVAFLRRLNFGSRDQFLEAIQEATSRGRIVVCKDHYPDVRRDFSIESIEESLGMDREQSVQAIDAECRALKNAQNESKDDKNKTTEENKKKKPTKTKPKPKEDLIETEYETLTLREFYDNTRDFNKVQAVLDLPLAHRSMPPDIESLDEGLGIGWNRTLVEHQDVAESFRINPLIGRTWGLLHHGGFMTYPHHDGDGYNTYIIPRCGSKLWAVLQVNYAGSGDQNNVIEHLLNLLSDNLLKQQGYTQDANVFIIRAEPGDLVIQPPGTWHTVYTPQCSIATGGSFLSYNTMHLSEFSMRLDATHGLKATNQDGGSSIFTILRMLLALPQLPKRVFYERAILAMCVMVLYPDDYMPEREAAESATHPETSSPLFVPAQDMAKYILKDKLGCDLRYAKTILYVADWTDPGQDFCLGEFYMNQK